MKKLSILFAVLLATGCASTGGSTGGGSAGGSAMMSSDAMNKGATDYDGIVAEAKAEMKKAKKMGGLWRDAGKILKKAEAAKKAGDDKEAMKLAKKARFQGRMGQAQAAGQKNAGPWLF